MAIDDFEWQGELTEPSRAKVAEQAAERARVAQVSWLARLRSSVWLEPVLRLGGTALLLGALAGIGIVATTYPKPGKALPEGPRTLAAALGSSWLKPTAPEKDEHAHGSAPARSPVPAAEASAAPAPVASVAPPGGGSSSGVTADGKVILNLASATELTKLPGVGMKRAEAIVALRTKLKRFRQPTDLLRVKGIGPRGLKRMLPHLVLDPPA